MQQFSNPEIAEIKSRIDQIHDMLTSRGGEAPAAMEEMIRVQDARADGADAPRAALLNHVSFSIQMRRIRKSHFGGAQLSGPTWDMMLDLMLADTHGRELSASDLATGAGVPLSSGLRMIAALEEHGLARRFVDERDRRRSLVRLTDSGVERMATYFEKTTAIWQDSQLYAT